MRPPGAGTFRTRRKTGENADVNPASPLISDLTPCCRRLQGRGRTGLGIDVPFCLIQGDAPS